MRTGIGFDIHRLVLTEESQSLPIGGVGIPSFYRIMAHSDGDVLLHAVIDGLLGSLALGDIGQWFPDNDPKYRGVPSKDFFPPVLEKIRSMGFYPYQIDANIFLEEPKVSPYRDTIRQSLAKLTGCELSFVSVKAKTMEGLGPIGERLAVAAQAIITVKEIDNKGLRSDSSYR